MRENDRALGPARRVKLDVFDVPAAGAYTLRAEGLPERAIASETELLLAPAPSDTQSMGALVPYILGTVGGALLSMGALLSTLFTLYRS